MNAVESAAASSSAASAVELGPAALAARWQALLEAQPALRIRDAARKLGVSELELRLTTVGQGTTRLVNSDLQGLVHRMPELGRVMTLTRNEVAVHETIGTFGGIGFEQHMGVVHHDNIDLRLFQTRWRHVVAVEEQVRDHVRRSLQVFDPQGEAVLKVFLRTRSNVEAYEAIVRDFLSPDQSPTVVLEPRPERAAPPSDDAVDLAAFQSGWLGLRDTHDFYPLLRTFSLDREQALRLAPAGQVTPVEPDALRRVLEAAASTGLEIMVFVGNPGCIQIYSGPIEKLVPMEGWLNVMDPGFNLHVRTAGLARAYVVRKPTADGTVTALECFDADGELVVQLFGARKPGKPELEGWRALCESL